VYDWLWVTGTWDRVGPAAKRAREKAGVVASRERCKFAAA
jgi:hypothetical protein